MLSDIEIAQQAKMQKITAVVCHLVLALCGAGGSRTLVQTGKQYAFYMFIPDFIFVRQQDLDHQPTP